MTVTREIPHGTINGYDHYRCRCDLCKAAQRAYRPARPVPHGTPNGYDHYGCRCDRCRRAHNDYARERGYNRRAGAVGRRKRWADENLKHPCENGCGRLCDRTARKCAICQRMAAHAARYARRAEIQRRWLAGENQRQIALALGSTPGSIHVEIARMRRDGWDMPPRRPRPIRR